MRRERWVCDGTGVSESGATRGSGLCRGWALLCYRDSMPVGYLQGRQRVPSSEGGGCKAGQRLAGRESDGVGGSRALVLAGQSRAATERGWCEGGGPEAAAGRA